MYVQVPCSVNKIIVTKSKEVKTISNLAEPSKEGCGLKRAVLSIILLLL
jgi:hypothetical protein